MSKTKIVDAASIPLNTNPQTTFCLCPLGKITSWLANETKTWASAHRLADSAALGSIPELFA